MARPMLCCPFLMSVEPSSETDELSSGCSARAARACNVVARSHDGGMASSKAASKGSEQQDKGAEQQAKDLSSR